MIGASQPLSARRAVDVVVVGAGPAGSTAAMVLAGLGHRVVVLERACEHDGAEKPRIGESLPSAARAVMCDLGVWDAFLAEPHAPCYGNRSIWGSEQPHVVDCIADPNGHGWHLNRVRFDAFLQNESARRGATILYSVKYESAASTANDEYRWRVVFHDVALKTLDCRVLIDATGRSAFVARSLGAQRHEEDRVVSVYLTLVATRSTAEPDRDSFTLVEAVPTGWWYSSLLPSGDRMLAFQTDADLPVVHQLRDTGAFLAHAHRTQAIRGAITGRVPSPNSSPRLVRANSASCSPPAGVGWLAVGDAAISFDPLSSQGLLNALYTGMTGAHAVAGSLASDHAAWLEFVDRVARIHAAYRRNLRINYGLETRWRESEFWRRRLEEG